jgi:hypothetical protein
MIASAIARYMLAVIKSHGDTSSICTITTAMMILLTKNHTTITLVLLVPICPVV